MVEAVISSILVPPATARRRLFVVVGSLQIVALLAFFTLQKLSEIDSSVARSVALVWNRFVLLWAWPAKMFNWYFGVGYRFLYPGYDWRLLWIDLIVWVVASFTFWYALGYLALFFARCIKQRRRIGA